MSMEVDPETGDIIPWYQRYKFDPESGRLVKDTSPLVTQRSFDINPREMLFLMLLLKLSKTPEGVKILQGFFKMIGDALEALGRASAANPVTAWANPFLISMILEQFGLVSTANMVQFKVGLSLISGAEIAEGFVDTVHGIIPFAAHDPSDFPSQVDLGDKATIERKTKGEP